MEMVEAHLRRIEAVNPSLNAVVLSWANRRWRLPVQQWSWYSSVPVPGGAIGAEGTAGH